MGILCIVCRFLCFFVWRIDGFCSLVVRRLFCMYSPFQLVFGGIARMVETFLLSLAHIGTSCPFLLRGGFFVVDMRVLVCGCGGRIIRSIGRSRLCGEVCFGLAYSSIRIKR